ncbi:hypothetical protein SCLCIDRAFT_144502, partial [Scleroderma citrinum Foug A]
TIQRRLAWPLHKDDTLSRSGRPTGLNIYFVFYIFILPLALRRPHCSSHDFHATLVQLIIGRVAGRSSS